MAVEHSDQRAGGIEPRNAVTLGVQDLGVRVRLNAAESNDAGRDQRVAEEGCSIDWPRPVGLLRLDAEGGEAVGTRLDEAPRPARGVEGAYRFLKGGGGNVELLRHLGEARGLDRRLVGEDRPRVLRDVVDLRVD